MTSKIPAYAAETDLEKRCAMQEQIITELERAAQYTLAALGDYNDGNITAPRWIQAHLAESRKALKAAIKACAPTVDP